MAKLTRHHSGGARVLMFIVGIICGYVTLAALPTAFDSTLNQVGTVFFAMMAFGGLYGALVGKQSI